MESSPAASLRPSPVRGATSHRDGGSALTDGGGLGGGGGGAHDTGVLGGVTRDLAAAAAAVEPAAAPEDEARVLFGRFTTAHDERREASPSEPEFSASFASRSGSRADSLASDASSVVDALRSGWRARRRRTPAPFGGASLSDALDADDDPLVRRSRALPASSLDALDPASRLGPQTTTDPLMQDNRFTIRELQLLRQGYVAGSCACACTVWAAPLTTCTPVLVAQLRGVSGAGLRGRPRGAGACAHPRESPRGAGCASRAAACGDSDTDFDWMSGDLDLV